MRIRRCNHQWRAQSVDLYEAKYGTGETLVLMRCTQCGHVKTRQLDGLWSLAQVNGETHGNALTLSGKVANEWASR